MRYNIEGMIDNNWYLMNHMFHDLMNEVSRISNKAIQMYHFIEGTQYEYKQKYSKKLNLEDLAISPKSPQAYIAKELKKEFTKLNTSSVETVNMKVKKEWTAKKIKINTAQESMINYRRDNANILARATQYKIEPLNNNEYKIGIRLLNKSYAEWLNKTGYTITTGKDKNKQSKTYRKNNDDIWVYFKVKAYDNTQKTIIEKIITKEYKLGTSAILYNKRKKKWAINLAYTFTPEKKQLDKNRVMGIDVGVNVPAMLAISEDKYYWQAVGDGKEILNFQNQMNSRKRRLQQSRKWAGKGSVGHGVKTRIKPLEKLSGKIARFKDHKNHVWSRYIVDEAVRNNCGVIQMEDLTGISSSSALLKTWTYYDLQTKIIYKAKEVGIEVKKINPKHTSSRCNRCGFVHTGKLKKGENPPWRPSQDKFVCQHCGHGEKHYVNADINAAKNIAIKDIEKIIKKQLKVQSEQKKK